jgi:hypothetical protein
MTPQEALRELLARVSAGRGAVVYVSEEELNGWPVEAARVFKRHKLLVKSGPASSAVCPGCEQECVMSVHVRVPETGKPQVFVFCDKRSDISLVPVPSSRMEQWQSSGLAIADVLGALIGSCRTVSSKDASDRWELGVFKGAKGSSHLTLVAEDGLALKLAGHRVELTDIMTLERDEIKLDRVALRRLADKPIAGGGDAESAEQRRMRLKKLVAMEKDKGNRAFQKAVANLEGISVQRLKQILEEKPGKNSAGSRRKAY